MSTLSNDCGEAATLAQLTDEAWMAEVDASASART
jgi:hypothetical protein